MHTLSNLRYNYIFKISHIVLIAGIILKGMNLHKKIIENLVTFSHKKLHFGINRC